MGLDQAWAADLLSHRPPPNFALIELGLIHCQSVVDRSLAALVGLFSAMCDRYAVLLDFKVFAETKVGCSSYLRKDTNHDFCDGSFRNRYIPRGKCELFEAECFIYLTLHCADDWN